MIPPHHLTNFEIEAYCQNENRFNGVYSRDNLPDNRKDGAYIINLDEYSDVGTHWVALYVNDKQHTLIALGLSIIQKKSKNLSIIKI